MIDAAAHVFSERRLDATRLLGLDLGLGELANFGHVAPGVGQAGAGFIRT